MAILMGNTGMEQADVPMVATAKGTITAGRILHTDPEGSDPRSKHLMVTETEAQALERNGLAKRAEGAQDRDAARVAYERGQRGDTLDVHARGAERVARFADAENSVEATTGLDTRETTAYPRDQTVTGGVQGFQAAAAASELDDARSRGVKVDAPAPESDASAPAGAPAIDVPEDEEAPGSSAPAKGKGKGS